MAASGILGLHSHYFINKGSYLVAVWKGASLHRSSGGSAWIRGATLNSQTYAYMASLADSVFLVNGSDPIWEFNGDYWTTYENSLGAPVAKFIASNQNRLYLYDVKILGTRYLSRVMFSDPTTGNSIVWGFEEGTDLVTTADSAVITSASSLFKDRNIKVGDPLFIMSGGDQRAKEYVVQSVDSNTQITLTEELTSTATGVSFWTGGNWFDIAKDDGDFANGIGMVSNEILFFKQNSVYRYNPQGQELRQIKDMPGTLNPRSIVSWGGYCYWIHPSGIYRTSGGGGERISNAIDFVFSEDTQFTDLAEGSAWVNKSENTVNFCTLTTTLPDGTEYSNFTMSYDIDGNVWSFRNYPTRIGVTTQWLRNDEARVYFGNNASGVFQLDTGTSFNSSDIACEVELYPIYPAGEDAVVTFNRIRNYVKDGPDVQIFYKLLYKPRHGVEGVWDSDENWQALKGSQIGERVDWYFPTDARASGVKLKIVESGEDKTFLWEKLTLYWSRPSNF